MEHELDEQWGAISSAIRAEMAAARPRKLAQVELAGQVGISRDALINYLSGRREMPILVFLKIAEELKVSPQWILDEADRRLAKGR